MKKLIYTAFSLFVASCGSLKKEDELNKKELLNFQESLWLKGSASQYKVDENWWSHFNNEELNKLIEMALADSADLSVMHQRVLLAEQQVKAGQAAMRPVNDLSVSNSYSKNNKSNNVSTQFKTSASLSWELDIWGKLSKLQKVALADYKVSEAEWRATCLKVIAQTTQYYFQLRQYDELLMIHQQALGISDTVQRHYQNRVDGGLENDEKAKSQLAESLRLKANMSDISRQRALSLNQLAIILGQLPGTFQLPQKTLTASTSFIDLPEKISANLLENRPDLIAAELKIKSAWYNKEVARAAKLPEISFVLSGELSAETISKLSGNWLALFMPKIRFPALNPQADINVKTQRINLQIRQKEYRQAVVVAVGEVENSLINLAQRKKQYLIEVRRLNTLKEAQQKSQERFNEGLITPLEVLNYQQQILTSKQQILSLYSLLLSDSVTLHNALGGSW
ncbi:MAG: efflux transporter outer membrane subunit [Lentisphaeraceae bacterium]|nr:efflux transporter outer membrane subunit [Lentisphaeraceae bacterium]